MFGNWNQERDLVVSFAYNKECLIEEEVRRKGDAKQAHFRDALAAKAAEQSALLAGFLYANCRYFTLTSLDIAG